MRILYHHRTQGRGAEGNHIVSIVTALRALGHEVDVLSPAGVDPFDAAATIPLDKAAARASGWSALWGWLSRHAPGWLFEIAEIAYNVPAWLRLRRQLRTGKYQLVYERYAFYLLAGALAARRAGCQFLLEANEVSGVPSRARRQSFPWLCAWFERRLIHRCTRVHAVSSYLGERLIAAGLPASRLKVVSNGFDTQRLKLTTSRTIMRERLGYADQLVVGFAGWFDEWDRLDFLLEVVAALHATNPRLRLLLIGAGPVADNLKELAAARGLNEVLVMTGAVPRAQVYDYLQTLDIGILPHSNLFGSPIVMFEMMGLGIPVVAPRLPPIVDVHGTGGATALLFTPLSLPDCQAQLQRLLQSAELRTTLASAARQRLEAEHSWRRTAARIIDGL
jgi:glycosyltransferase involved in cell wall biosynthesis